MSRTWGEIMKEMQGTPPEGRSSLLLNGTKEALAEVSRLRQRPVILYASGFLQFAGAPPWSLQIMPEDLNGLVTCIRKLDCARGLTLVLHTPGGVITATEAMVDYLLQKFANIEVIVPTFAQSAGTMMALASNRLILAKHSQLGPIDSQMNIGGRTYSAAAVVSTFETARAEIMRDPKQVGVWAPILSSFGPTLLEDAKNALGYGEAMVQRWLAARMFSGDEARATEVAAYFNNAKLHKSHGRRIGIAECRAQGLLVDALEDSQDLQDAVMGLYHYVSAAMIALTITKIIINSDGVNYIRQGMPAPGVAAPPRPPASSDAPSP